MSTNDELRERIAGELERLAASVRDWFKFNPTTEEATVSENDETTTGGGDAGETTGDAGAGENDESSSSSGEEPAEAPGGPNPDVHGFPGEAAKVDELNKQAAGGGEG